MTFNTYSTGTVSVANGATSIVGVGSNWSGVNAKPGDDIVIGGNTVIVMDVVNATTLTINPWPYTTVASGTAYNIVQRSPLRYAGGQAMSDVSTLVGALNTDGFYVFVPSIATVPDPSYGNDGQYAFQASTGKLWIKTGGAWSFLGVYKGLSFKGAYNGASAYGINDVVTYNNATYIAIGSTTGNLPTNATYWTLMAAAGVTGATGPVPFKAVAAWATATAYVTGPPADYVTINGSSYQCLVAHTSGTFATDLAAGKWGLVAQAGVNAPTYGGTSTTSRAIATGAQAFTTQAGLAYTNGGRVRASSNANAANYMEGAATYSGTTLTITVDRTNGSGAFADWNFNIAGQPGAGSGDMQAANNLSDVANVATARSNLGIKQGVSLAASQDFNAVSNEGSYVTVDTASTNAPSASNFILEVRVFDANNKLQRATRTSDGSVFFREQIATTWGAWHQVAFLDSSGDPPEGRLTLVSGTPVMTASQSSKGTLYYTPYQGNSVPIYNGSNFVMVSFPEISVAATDTTKNPAAIAAGKVNDWFIWNDAGTLRLSHGPDWTSDTARSAGTALTLVNGIYLNSLAITNGPAASRGTYVGTTRADAGAGTLSFIFGSSAVGGGSAWFGVWNMYNRVSIPSGIVTDSTGSWTYATATFRATNNQNGMRISAIFGQVEDAINAAFTSYMTNGAASAGVLGVGLNTTSSNAGTATGGQAVNTSASLTSLLSAFPSFGFNFIQALEYAAGTGNVTFYGSNSIPAVYGNSLTATLRM